MIIRWATYDYETLSPPGRRGILPRYLQKDRRFWKIDLQESSYVGVGSLIPPVPIHWGFIGDPLELARLTKPQRGDRCIAYQETHFPKPQRGDRCVVHLVISSRGRVWKLDLRAVQQLASG